jgi:hypothetical protein
MNADDIKKGGTYTFTLNNGDVWENVKVTQIGSFGGRAIYKGKHAGNVRGTPGTKQKFNRVTMDSSRIVKVEKGEA